MPKRLLVEEEATAPLLRTSTRKDFRRCWWLWDQHWEKGISPKRQPTWSIFGSAIHKALETYYKPGSKRAPIGLAIEAFHDFMDGEVRKVGVDVFEEEYERAEAKAEADGKSVKLVPAHELGPLMLTEYVKKYGRDSDWEVIHTEQPFQINVPRPNAPRNTTLVVYAGTWDVLMWKKSTGQYWLWDHKTARAIPALDVLQSDDQAGSYLWVAKEVLVHKGLLSKKDRIHGIVFNYLKKSEPDKRPTDSAGRALNQNGSVSARQPAARFLRYEAERGPEAMVAQARRVQQEAVVMQKVRDGELPVLKNRTHDCPRCILWDMCDAHEQGDDWEALRDELYVVRDGFADHREAMARNGIEL